MKRTSLIQLLALVAILSAWTRLELFAQNFTDIQANLGDFWQPQFDVGDYDRDGDLDVIVSGMAPPSYSVPLTSIYRNDGGGVFTLSLFSVPLHARDIGWVDLDGDRDLDFYLISATGSPAQYTLDFYRNDSSLGFAYMSSGVPMIANSIKWADFDNDGDPDILQGGNLGGSNYVTRIHLNQGNGVFQQATHNLPYLTFDGRSVIGDYDNDGDLDIIGGGSTAGKNIYRNEGALNFTAITTTINPGASEYEFGDYDADGDLDLATNTGRIFRNDAGVYSQVATFPGSNSGGFLDWADYDNDGDLDIVHAGGMYIPMNYLPPILRVQRNDGNNVFTSLNFGTVGLETGDIRWGDFDNNGKVDIIGYGNLYTLFPRTAVLYQNTGAAPANTPPASPTGLQASIAPDSSIIFKWNRSTDAITPDSGLSYRLWISTSSGLPGIPDQASPLSDIATGRRLIAGQGNLQDTSWNFKNFPLGQTFYARIQAIDGGLMGSAWSPAVAVTDTLLGGSINTAVVGGVCQLNAPGAAYVDSIRWYQCSPWQMVPGANQATFQPGNSNAHAAILYMGMEADTTACLTTNSSPGIDTTVQVQVCYATGIGASQADSVQWIDCNSMLPLPGETNATLFPASTGDYALVLYHCKGIDTSGCHTLQQSLVPANISSTTCGLVTGIPSMADSVQWIDCNSMLAIPGANDSTFIPNSAGDYAVVFYACQTTDTSTCVTWTPFVLNTNIIATGSVLSLPGGPQADSIQWLWCQGGPNSGPLPDNTSSVFKAIVTGSYQAILYHCNGSDTTACQYVDAQFVQLPSTSAPMTGVSQGSVNWGDFDNDADLDLLVTGFDTFQTSLTQLYRNNGNGTFTALSTSLPQLESADAAWGDCDNDGDLDLLIAGWNGLASQALTRIYRNDGAGVFTDVQAGLDSVSGARCSWADYDNDGDLDAFVCGGNPPRSNLYRNDGSNQFSLQPAGFDGVIGGSANWGDYDSDGDLDLVYSGLSVSPANPITRLYRNDGNGVFVSVPHNFPAVTSGSTIWGDYDSDGYLDLVVCGFDLNQVVHADLFHNNAGASFSPVNSGFRAMGDGEAAWGDVDNDGHLDLIITGGFSWGNQPAIRVYRNLGNSTFDEITTWPNRPAVSSTEWSDFDSDGDLDLALTGVTSEGWQTLVFRNDSVQFSNLIPLGPPIVNAAPGGPGAINLTWNPGSDATTPTQGLSYQLMVGTTPGGREVVSPMADTTSGLRLLPQPGPIQGTSWTLENTQVGQSYYARVFAIDAGRSASQPSATGVLLGTDNAGDPLLLQAGPIPTSDWLLVKVPIFEAESRLDLVDLQGRKVLSQVVSANQAGEVKLDLSELASGTYLLRWKSAEVAEVLTLKVVKEW